MTDLPDVSQWQPTRATDSLDEAFVKRCLAAEEMVRLRADVERRMAVHNFDAGLPLEEVVRDELRRILPDRYAVHAGTVVDANGFTAGDCDVVIFNDMWFPAVKPGPVNSSRHVVLPIEGAYAIGEIKQSLTRRTLDDAMEKLVKCHRLERSPTFAHRLVENREHCGCIHGLSNPLYCFVIAVGVGEGEDLQELIRRFFDISTKFRRQEVIRSLCILGHGCVTWGFEDPDDPRHSTKPALFMEEDLYKPIYPVWAESPRHGPALYALVMNLMLHLFHSVLAPEDLPANYGPTYPQTSVPTDRVSVSLPPDAEWLERLKKPCSRHNCDLDQ